MVFPSRADQAKETWHSQYLGGRGIGATRTLNAYPIHRNGVGRLVAYAASNIPDR